MVRNFIHKITIFSYEHKETKNFFYYNVVYDYYMNT